MNDRDRLAADLHDIACGASARFDWRGCVRDHRHEADRLIDLNWTHDCGDSFISGYEVATKAAPLDEERLARALAAHRQVALHPYGHCRRDGCAAAIATAYREDTDA